MHIGKVSVKTLENSVFSNVKKTQQKSEIVVRPSIGEDCAAIAFDKELCILSSDPITSAASAYQAGYIALHVNCNDIFASGGQPLGILLTILLPEGASEQALVEIMKGASDAAEELAIEIIGGHTEVTDAVTRPVISAAVIGKAALGGFIHSSGAVPGQSVVLTKYAGLEGTAILANDFPERLKALPLDVLDRAKALTGALSVKKEAALAKEHGATAMHDVTEGGVMGACWEMAACSSVGVRLDLDQIPILAETAQICAAFQINPYQLISSGALLIAAFDGARLVEKLQSEGVHAAVVGEFTSKQDGMVFIKNNRLFPLGEPVRDEIYKAHRFREQCDCSYESSTKKDEL